jgi:hypothetical protein
LMRYCKGHGFGERETHTDSAIIVTNGWPLNFLFKTKVIYIEILEVLIINFHENYIIYETEL